MVIGADLHPAFVSPDCGWRNLKTGIVLTAVPIPLPIVQTVIIAGLTEIPAKRIHGCQSPLDPCCKEPSGATW